MSEIASELGSAAAIGCVAGMRTLLMPALVSHAPGVDTSGSALEAGAARLIRSRAARRTLPLAAAGELIGDKLPFAPDRTELPALAARAASGAVVAAVLASWRRRSPTRAALVAAGSAVVAAHLLIRVRRVASRRVPDPLVAVAEDCVALAIGWSLIRAALEPHA